MRAFIHCTLVTRDHANNPSDSTSALLGLKPSRAFLCKIQTMTHFASSDHFTVNNQIIKWSNKSIPEATNRKPSIPSVVTPDYTTREVPQEEVPVLFDSVLRLRRTPPDTLVALASAMVQEEE